MTAAQTRPAAVHVKAIVESGDFFSIDIFDTLLFRACLHPADVFSFALARCGLHGASPNFKEERVNAERLARELYLTGQNHDITHDQIYEVFRNITGSSKALAQALQQAEIEAELTLSYLSPFGAALLSRLRQEKKRFVLASDMYLSRATIESMLKKAGIAGHERLFLSNELGRSKHHGSMFPDVIRHFDAEPSRIVHIGDNAHSDGEMARSKGLRTFVYSSDKLALATASDIYRAAACRGHSNLKVVFLSIHLQNLADESKRAFDLEGEDIYWRAVGALVLAPILVSLTAWLKATCDENGIRKLFFLARDGLIVKRAFDIIYLSEGFETRYVAASRRLLTLPSHILSPSELKGYYTHLSKQARTGEEVLSAIAGGEALRERLKALGFDLSMRRKGRSFRKLMHAVGENSGLLTLALRREWELTTEYLRKEFIDVEHESAGVFDLGWRGSLQTALARAIPEHAARLLGLYFGTTSDAFRMLACNGLAAQAYAMNFGQPEDLRNACQLHTDVIEFLFGAQHGSVERLEKGERGFEWVLSDVSAEESECHAIAAQIQDGALQAIRDVAATIGRAELQSLPDRDADLRDFFNFMFNPTAIDAGHFARVRVFSGIGDNVGEPLCAPPRHMSLRRGLRQSRWKSAYIAGLSRVANTKLRLSEKMFGRVPR